MDKNTIGINAGLVWNTLCDNRPWTYKELKATTGLADRDLNAAIGWLARENKISFEDFGGNRYVSLMINVFFG